MKRGYTLIELIIAIGLFALIMMLSSGAYLMMIGLNRQAQGIATGIDSLSFALESMTRDIRTGSSYCGSSVPPCALSVNPGSFSFKNKDGVVVTYSLSGSTLMKTVGATPSPLTDPSVTISSLVFYAVGTQPAPSDREQSRVTITVSGTVSAGAGKTQTFNVETGATMRGSDI